MKISEQLLRQKEFVEDQLGDRVICERCKCTLKTYADCPAELSDPCPGFMIIEQVRKRYAAPASGKDGKQ